MTCRDVAKSRNLDFIRLGVNGCDSYSRPALAAARLHLEKLVALLDGSLANVEAEAEAERRKKEGRQLRSSAGCSAVNDEDHLDDAANPGADRS